MTYDMETRQEKDRYDMAIPEFKSEYCESCMKEAELINIGKVIKGRVNVKASYHVCLDCIKELRPVSGMTGMLRTINDWKLHREMGNKLVPYKSVNHI